MDNAGLPGNYMEKIERVYIYRKNTLHKGTQMKTNVQKLADILQGEVTIGRGITEKLSAPKETLERYAQAILSAGYVHKDDVELDISKELRQAFLNSKDPEIRKHINEIQAWRIKSAQSKDVIKIKETK